MVKAVWLSRAIQESSWCQGEQICLPGVKCSIALSISEGCVLKYITP